MTQPPDMTRPIVITMGDPLGIGPEICVKAHAEGHLSGCCVAGNPTRLKLAADLCGLDPAVLNTLKIVAVGPDDPAFADPKFGYVDPVAGQASLDYVLHAVKGVQDGLYAGLVTAPVNKEAWSKAGAGFPGHTELLAHKAGDVPVSMMLANSEIRTVPVTIHVPLRLACDMLTPELELQTIRRAGDACRALGIDDPRIAVCGLNPHAGEGGLFGSEDRQIIAPAIEAAKAEGLRASGPWPGDTVFARARKGEFDIVVAQYHDQGLIPVKYNGVGNGVNATIGLPFVRTSPDHGTAFDIAGTGVANAGGLVTAVAYARRLIRHQT